MLTSEGTTFRLFCWFCNHCLFHTVHHTEGHFMNLMAYIVEVWASLSMAGYIESWPTVFDLQQMPIYRHNNEEPRKSKKHSKLNDHHISIPSSILAHVLCIVLFLQGPVFLCANLHQRLSKKPEGDLFSCGRNGLVTVYICMCVTLRKQLSIFKRALILLIERD